MSVSRNALQSWPDLQSDNNPLAGVDNERYFKTRDERNAFYANKNISAGYLTAVGGDPKDSDWDKGVWDVDEWNGANWHEVNLDQNFALIVTNEGIKALTDASAGQYKLEVSRVAIKKSPIVAGTDVRKWTDIDFVGSDGYIDICLDTDNSLNPTFTLTDNLTYRTNLSNGGIQFTISLGLDCLGQYVSTKMPAPGFLTDFTVSAVGLYVKDQRELNKGQSILFAVANLPTSVEKLTTTPTRVGNALKFYLNTTLSNFGNVVNLTNIQSSVGSVPEVTTEDDIIDEYDGVNAPYNLYIVDDFNGTNIPALAVRKGDPISPTNPLIWSYFTPTDDALAVDKELLADDVKDYMTITWDSSVGKYIPTNAKNKSALSGLYTRNYIVYAGKIVNNNTSFVYTPAWNNDQASGYRVGDILTIKLTANGKLKPDEENPYQTFTVTITAVNPISGIPTQYKIYPNTGNIKVATPDWETLDYDPSSQKSGGVGLKLKMVSGESEYVAWNFPSSWVNKPLYTDYDHRSESEEEWDQYLIDADLPDDTDNRDRRGYLTTVQRYYSQFVGWCINETTIKLALDLRNEATETIYGTTRYATNTEVKNCVNNPNAKATTSITPETLYNNYIKKEPSGNVTGVVVDGDDLLHPQVVNTYVRFMHPIVGSGMNIPNASTLQNENVSFYGTAFQSLWADLAEYYHSDRQYAAGTLICIGDGIAEITEARTECNGIISTKPGYQLGEHADPLDLPVALVGKVPVLFDGKCAPHFGDYIYLSRDVPGRASNIPFGKCLGKVIDKRKNLDQISSILCSVRISF